MIMFRDGRLAQESKEMGLSWQLSLSGGCHEACW
jgi:hypothetical protein